ncbi:MULTISPECIES: hypothetical protein [Bacillaceae]|uniref:hypothetical protein n=1 Tax=Bacillaceae TaxID=186817 RepID=UPI00217CF506|nr:hypothetical protein [Bacillus sp. PK3_68]
MSFVIVIIGALMIDFFWLDVESKRWKWLKNRSKPQQVLFFVFFMSSSLVLYYLFGHKFLS